MNILVVEDYDNSIYLAIGSNGHVGDSFNDGEIIKVIPLKPLKGKIDAYKVIISLLNYPDEALQDTFQKYFTEVFMAGLEMKQEMET
jgi:hypothetical protein